MDLDKFQQELDATDSDLNSQLENLNIGFNPIETDGELQALGEKPKKPQPITAPYTGPKTGDVDLSNPVSPTPGTNSLGRRKEIDPVLQQNPDVKKRTDEEVLNIALMLRKLDTKFAHTNEELKDIAIKGRMYPEWIKRLVEASDDNHKRTLEDTKSLLEFITEPAQKDIVFKKQQADEAIINMGESTPDAANNVIKAVKDLSSKQQQYQSEIDRVTELMKDPANAQNKEYKSYLQSLQQQQQKTTEDLAKYAPQKDNIDKIEGYQNEITASMKAISDLYSKHPAYVANELKQQLRFEQIQKDYDEANALGKVGRMVVSSTQDVANQVLKAANWTADRVVDYATSGTDENQGDKITKKIDTYFDETFGFHDSRYTDASPLKELTGIEKYANGTINSMGSLALYGFLGNLTELGGIAEGTNFGIGGRVGNYLKTQTQGYGSAVSIMGVSTYMDTKYQVAEMLKDSGYDDKMIESISHIAGMISGVAQAAAEGFFDEGKAIGLLTNSSFLHAIEKNGKFGVKDIFKEFKNNFIDEEKENLLSDIGEIMQKVTTNTLAGSKVYGDIMPTLGDLVDEAVYTASGMFMMSGPGYAATKKNTLRQMAVNNPVAAKRSFQAIIDSGKQPAEVVQPYMEQLDGYARQAFGFPKNAKPELTNKFFDALDVVRNLEGQAEQVKDIPEQANIFNTMIAAKKAEMSGLLQQMHAPEESKTDKTIINAENENQVLNKEGLPMTHAEQVNQMRITQDALGQTEQTNHALNFLDQLVNKPVDEIKSALDTNGVHATAITQANQNLTTTKDAYDKALLNEKNNPENKSLGVETEQAKKNYEHAQKIVEGVSKLTPAKSEKADKENKSARAMTFNDEDGTAKDDKKNGEDKKKVDTKIVDKQGEPLHVYQNNHSEKPEMSKGNKERGGAFFTPHPKGYEDYGPNKHKATLSLKNPYYTSQGIHHLPGEIERLKALGHDGIITHNGYDYETPKGVSAEEYSKTVNKYNNVEGHDNRHELDLKHAHEIIAFDEKSINHVSTINNTTREEKLANEKKTDSLPRKQKKAEARKRFANDKGLVTPHTEVKPTQTKTENALVNEAVERLSKDPSNENILAYIADKVASGELSKENESRTRSKIVTALGMKSSARAITFNDEEAPKKTEPTKTPEQKKIDDKTEKLKAIDDQKKREALIEKRKQKATNADKEESNTELEKAGRLEAIEKEYETGLSELTPLGTVTGEQIMELNVLTALSDNNDDFLNAYQEILNSDSPDQKAFDTFRDKVLGKLIDDLNKRFGTNISLKEIDETGYFPNKNSIGNVYGILNNMLGKFSNENKFNLFANYARSIIQTADEYVSKSKTIEAVSRNTANAVLAEYGIHEISQDENMEPENDQEEEMTNDEVLVTVIADKETGGKETRIAEGIANVINKVFEIKAKSQGYKVNKETIDSFGFVSSLFRQYKTLSGVVNYVNTRLNSKENPLVDKTLRLQYEAIGEVLYKYANQLHKSANYDPYVLSQQLNSLKSVFSGGMVFSSQAVSINENGDMSFFETNRDSEYKNLQNEITAEINNTLNSILADHDKREQFFALKNEMQALKGTKDLDSLERLYHEMLEFFNDSPKVKDAMANGVNLNISFADSLTAVAFNDKLRSILNIFDNFNEGNNNEMLSSIIASYVKRQQSEAGNEPGSRRYDSNNQRNTSNIARPSRNTSLIANIASEAKKLYSKLVNRNAEEKDPITGPTNFTKQSSNREFSEERKKQLENNPLVAVVEFASKLRSTTMSEIKKNIGRLSSVPSKYFTGNNIALLGVVKFAQAIKNNNSEVHIINQVTNSPTKYATVVPRIYGHNGDFTFSKKSPLNKEIIKNGGLLHTEVQRAVTAIIEKRKSLNLDVSDNTIKQFIPSFYNVSNGIVEFSEAQLNAEAGKSFNNYLNAIAEQYINFQTTNNAEKAREEFLGVMKDLSNAFDSLKNNSATNEMKLAIEKIEHNISLNKESNLPAGVKEFLKKLQKDFVVYPNATKLDIDIKHNAYNTKSLMREFVVNEEAGRYYHDQIVKGNVEYFSGKDSNYAMTYGKLFDSPGISVPLDRPFTYAILSTDFFAGTDNHEDAISEFTSSTGNKINTTDGVQFISETAAFNITASLGPQLGFTKLFKWAMSTVNTKGVPTAHKAMQVTLTSALAQGNPALTKLYNYMQRHNLDSVLMPSAEKLGNEEKTKATYENGNLFLGDPIKHTANYSDIFVQLPINQDQRGREIGQTAQFTAMSHLLVNSPETAEANKDLQDALGDKIASVSLLSAIKNGAMVKLMKAYRENRTDAWRGEGITNLMISYINILKSGQSKAVQSKYDAIIQKIKSGYTFETDNQLLYEVAIARFKDAGSNKVPGLYLSLMSSIALKDGEKPKFEIGKNRSEIIIPESMREHVKQYLDENDNLVGMAMKVPYANAGTQMRVKVKFNKNLNNSGSVVVAPDLYTYLSNSDHDGDFLFVYPRDVNYKAKFNQTLESLGINHAVSSIEGILHELPKLNEHQKNTLLSAFTRYNDNKLLEANDRLNQGNFGRSMQNQANDLSDFKRNVERMGFVQKAKNLFSASSQIDRTNEINGSKNGIGIAASMIGLYNHIMGINETSRMTMRPTTANVGFVKVNNTMFDMASLDTSIVQMNRVQEFEHNGEKGYSAALSYAREMAKYQYTQNGIEGKVELTSAQKQEKMNWYVQQELNALFDNMVSYTPQSAKRSFMNTTTQVLQIGVDSIKKGYADMVNLNDQNMGLFNHIASVVGLNTHDTAAMETAVKFINQPIIKLYHELTKPSSMLRQEYRGYGSVLDQLENDLLGKIKNNFPNNTKVSEVVGNPVANLDTLNHKYNEIHVNDIDHTFSKELQKNEEYMIAQLEAIKAMRQLEPILRSVTQFTRNRKKFEDIAAKMDDSRAFINELQKMGLIADRNTLNSVLVALDNKETLGKIIASEGVTNSIFTSINDSPLPYQKVSEARKAYDKIISLKKQITNAQEDNNSPLVEQLLSEGLEKHEAIGYLESLISMEIPKMLNNGSSMFDDPGYRAKAENFFRAMAHAKAMMPMYSEGTQNIIFENIVKPLVDTKNNTAVNQIINDTIDTASRMLLKDELGNIAINEMANESPEFFNDFTYNMNKMLSKMFQLGRFFPNNGFVRNLVPSVASSTVIPTGEFEGRPQYTRKGYIVENGVSKPVNVNTFVPISNAREAFNKAMALTGNERMNAMTEAALSAAIDEIEANNKEVLFDAERGRFYSGYTGKVFDIGREELMEKGHVAEYRRDEHNNSTDPKQTALFVLRHAALGTISANGKDTFEQWKNAIGTYVSDKFNGKESPRYRKPNAQSIGLNKPSGSTEFTQSELEDIREGIDAMTSQMNEPVYDNDGKKTSTIKEELKKFAEVNGISLPNQFFDKYISSPEVWLHYFADQISYSRVRNLVNVLNASQNIEENSGDSIINSINQRFENLANDSESPLNNPEKIYLMKPTMTQFVPLETLQGLKENDTQARNIAQNSAYIHTKVGGQIQLYKRITVGYSYTTNRFGKSLFALNHQYALIGVYNETGETNLEKIPNGESDITKGKQLATMMSHIQVTDNLMNKAQVEKFIQEALIGVNHNIDIPALFKDIISTASNQGFKGGINNESVIKSLRLFIEKYALNGPTYDPSKPISEQERLWTTRDGQAFDKTEAVKIVQALNVLERLGNKTDNKEPKPLLMGNTELADAYGVKTEKTTRKFIGRKMTSTGYADTQKSKTVLDYLQGFMNAINGSGRSSMQGRTIKEWKDLYNKTGKEITTLDGMMNLMANKLNLMTGSNMMVQAMKNQLGAVPVKIHDTDSFKKEWKHNFGDTNVDSRFAAFYDGKTIHFSEDMQASDSGVAIIHEAFHALTTHAINDPNNVALRNELIEVVGQIKGKLGDLINEAKPGSKELNALSKLKMALERNPHDDLLTAEEMMAEIWADSSGTLAQAMSMIQNESPLLTKYQHEGTSLWSKFKSIIARIFEKKFNGKEVNAVQNNMYNVISNIMDENSNKWNIEKMSVNVDANTKQVTGINGETAQSVHQFLEENTFEDNFESLVNRKYEREYKDSSIHTDKQRDDIKTEMKHELEDFAKNVSRINAFINDNIQSVWLGTMSKEELLSNLKTEFGDSVNFEDTNIIKGVSEAIERLDKAMNDAGEVVDSDLTKGMFFSTETSLAGNNAVISVNEDGNYIVNAVAYNTGTQGKTSSPFIGINGIGNSYAGITGYNNTIQRVIHNALIQSFILRQQGFPANDLRISITTDAEIGHKGVNQVIPISNVSQYDAMVREYLITHRTNYLESISSINAASSEIENGKFANYATGYLVGMHKAILDLPKWKEENGDKGFADWERSQTTDNKKNYLMDKTVAEKKLIFESQLMPLEKVLSGIESGTIADLSSQKMAELWALVNNLEREGALPNTSKSKLIRMGLSDFLLAQYQKKNLLEVQNEAMKLNDKKGLLLSGALSSIKDLPVGLPIDEMAKQWVSIMDRTAEDHKIFVDDYTKLAHAVIMEKKGIGKIKLLAMQATRKYGIRTTALENPFFNLYDKNWSNNTIDDIGGTKASMPLITLSKGKQMLDDGKISENEFKLLEKTHQFFVDNKDYLYQTAGVVGYTKMNEGKKLNSMDIDEQRHFIPYYPSGRMAIDAGSFGTGAYGKLKAFIDHKFFNDKSKVFDYTIPGTEITIRGNQGQIISKISDMERLYRENNKNKVIALTDEIVHDIVAKSKTAEDIPQTNKSLSEYEKQTFRLPGVARNNAEMANENLLEVMTSLSKQVAIARIYQESDGLSSAMQLVADEKHLKNLSKYIKADYENKILGKKFMIDKDAHQAVKAGYEVLRQINFLARMTYLAGNWTAQSTDMVNNMGWVMVAAKGVTVDENYNKKSRTLGEQMKGWIPAVNGSYAIAKSVQYAGTIYKIAKWENMLRNQESASTHSNNVIKDIFETIGSGAYSITGGTPRAILMADQLPKQFLDAVNGMSHKEYVKFKRENENVDHLVKNAVDFTEYHLGRFKKSTDAIGTSNPALAGVLMFKSWMANFYNSRFGNYTKVGDEIIEGRYKTMVYDIVNTALAAIGKEGRANKMSPEQLQINRQSYFQGSILGLIGLLGLLKQMPWDDDEEKDDDKPTWKKVMDKDFQQTLPGGTPQQMMYMVKGLYVPGSYIADCIAAMSTIASDATYKGDSKYGRAGESKIPFALAKVTPGSSMIKSWLRDSVKNNDIDDTGVEERQMLQY